ncbi:cell division protein FtsZ, partial [Arthrobacter nitrophenolicus]
QPSAQPVHAGVGAAGLSSWGQQRPSAVPADSGFDVDLPSVVEPDLTGNHPDDLDVPDFLK